MTGSEQDHLETRLLLIAEMLEKAVAEVRREIDHIRSRDEGPEPPKEPR